MDSPQNDMLMWLIEEAAEKPERSVRTIVQRLLATNFAAIHTSTNVRTQLAALHLFIYDRTHVHRV